MSDIKITRRDFIKLTVAGATVLAGSQIIRRAQALETAHIQWSSMGNGDRPIQMHRLWLLYTGLPGAQRCPTRDLLERGYRRPVPWEPRMSISPAHVCNVPMPRAWMSARCEPAPTAPMGS